MRWGERAGGAAGKRGGVQLIVIRHADAGDRAIFAQGGQPDRERPLSRKGRRQMRAVAAGLRTLVPRCDLIASSPYVRAMETAAIVARAWKRADEETTDALQPGRAPAEFVAWIDGHRDAEVVGVVGHEPDLGGLTTWLLTGQTESRVEFKKGGACLLAFDGRVRRGTGRLLWLLGPRELAAAGD